MKTMQEIIMFKRIQKGCFANIFSYIDTFYLFIFIYSHTRTHVVFKLHRKILLISVEKQGKDFTNASFIELYAHAVCEYAIYLALERAMVWLTKLWSDI